MLRRDFLADLARNAVLCATVPNGWRVRWHPRFADDPFQLGVASGDPTSTGCMLWTRLAPKPLEPDGGMSLKTIVNWEVASDEAFSQIVQRGRATAATELGYSVHADVTGLEPARWYFYRFHAGDAVSPVGRLRTMPAAGTRLPLTFSFISCQNYEQGLYTAHEHMAKESLDLVAFLGDYIYESGPGRTGVRTHATTEPLDLTGYRARYAQYKADPALMAAHALCPWLVIWDDHEVDNNYAGNNGENDMESEDQMRARRGAAYQAWWENQPVRVPRAKSWSDLSIMRTADWGSLARFHLLDGRQYRSDQACGDGTKVVPCGDWADPKRTMLGDKQERWISAGLARSPAHWQVLANQVMLAPFDSMPGPKQQFGMDMWSGYPAARERLLASIKTHARNTTVVITGDIHSNWVNELHASFDTSSQPTIAAEFVGTSISSEGDGAERGRQVTDAALSENPHVKWQNSRRGYAVCRVDGDAWETHYRTVPFVTKPGAPIETPTKWRVEHGRQGITRV